MSLLFRPLCVALVLASAAGSWAQQQGAGGIYTCVDAKGRKLTSDRPIPECADREQKELTSTGTVKRTVKPAMSAEERRVAEEKEKAEAEERLRLLEEKRKDRAILSRYPNRAAHDKERGEALSQIDVVINTASKRIAELDSQRKSINAELEFYKKDPAKAPLSLKRQTEDNDNNVVAQKRFISEQDGEKKRVNSRFDEELARLKTLWAVAGGAAMAAASSAAKK